MTVKQAQFVAPPSLAIADGATAPDPGGAEARGAVVWSTVTGGELVWSGSAWQARAAGGESTVLKVDGGSASTAFPDYLLRLDFGANGSTINPTGTP